MLNIILVLKIIRWRNSHIGWVLGEFCGYGRSPDADSKAADNDGNADVDSDAAAADSDADAAADAVFETFPNTLYAYA